MGNKNKDDRKRALVPSGLMTSEMDRIGMKGLKNLEAYLDGEETESAFKKANLTLKTINDSTKRITAENSRISKAVQLGKLAGAEAERYSEIWNEMGLPPVKALSS